MLHTPPNASQKHVRRKRACARSRKTPMLKRGSPTNSTTWSRHRWVLFLKYLHDLERERSDMAELDREGYPLKTHRWTIFAPTSERAPFRCTPIRTTPPELPLWASFRGIAPNWLCVDQRPLSRSVERWQLFTRGSLDAHQAIENMKPVSEISAISVSARTPRPPSPSVMTTFVLT